MWLCASQCRGPEGGVHAACSAALPTARWVSPRQPAQSLSDNLVSFLWAARRKHMKALPCGTSGAPGAGEQQCVLCFLCLQPGSELDNLEEILDDLQNSQLPQLFPESRPGAPAGSVDKQAIINDLMQLTSDSSPGTAVATQKPAMRISQSSESGLRMGGESVWSPKWGCRACGPAAGEEGGLSLPWCCAMA